jgi:2-C-methyl-D-erythritol 4-phosphate cytidylyltransferase
MTGEFVPFSVIVLTGGHGKRFQSKKPKQFAEVLGKPLFIHCLLVYSRMEEVKNIYLVVNENYTALYHEALTAHGLSHVKKILGGKDRQDSVENALKWVPEKDVVAIQNGVSCATRPSVIRKVVKTAHKTGAASAYISAFHTVFRHANGTMDEVLERNTVGYTCDPQAYCADILKKAFDSARKNNLTDRPTVELVQKIGSTVHLVESDQENLKVTIPSDIPSVEHILKSLRD